MSNTQYSKKLDTPVMYLKGVGEYRSKLLAKIGVHTVLDLMELFPRTYLSRNVNPSLAELQVGENVALTAEISWVDARPSTTGKKILHVGVNDKALGIECVWFRYPPSYLKIFKPGSTIWISGTLSSFNGQLQINHPEFEILDKEIDEHDFWKNKLLLPVYPLTEGLTQTMMRKLVYSCFEQYASYIEEVLPDFLLQKYGFAPRRVALQIMHFTEKREVADKTRRRFAYEEFFFSQILWARHKIYHSQNSYGIKFDNKKKLTTELKNKLSFKLTSAQKRVIREIFADMCSPRQMSRLIQGDVGSGKTIVTIFAMLLAVENGYQATLMAPTEILAEQHYQNFQKLLDGMGIKIILLKGGSYKGKTEQKKQIADGSAQIILGTHALIQKDVDFAKLGFVAVDEQHRFGVEQRAMLAKGNSHPDLLYISATPIPRSLAMTVYGDLQVSQIDEMPPNRKAVITYYRSERKLDTVFADVERELRNGRQAYFVCPLVEESEKLALLDAQRLYTHLKDKIYPSYSIELLHGRMSAKEKDAIMQRFKAGEIKILVTTTVIEVGVDVANASVMVIEHAERFGLAQLHQLRGRVGRGADQAYCFLIGHHPLSAMARERLNIMTRSTDGFVIAEKDLELRGPGEFFGYEQSGLPQFRFANLIADQSILNLARKDAFEIINKDFQMIKPEHEKLRIIYLSKYKQKESLILY
nr:ATP-dependent helicase RecG [Candidatus Cloacimonadota bacterium]